MKTLNETFTDTEYKKLVKQKGKLSWHDFIVMMGDYLEGGQE